MAVGLSALARNGSLKISLIEIRSSVLMANILRMSCLHSSDKQSVERLYTLMSLLYWRLLVWWFVFSFAVFLW